MIKKGWRDIKGTSDPESVILYCCGGDANKLTGDGFIMRSYNAGTTWTSVLPILDDITWFGASSPNVVADDYI